MTVSPSDQYLDQMEAVLAPKLAEIAAQRLYPQDAAARLAKVTALAAVQMRTYRIGVPLYTSDATMEVCRDVAEQAVTHCIGELVKVVVEIAFPLERRELH